MAARRKKEESALVRFDPLADLTTGEVDPEIAALIQQDSQVATAGGMGWPFFTCRPNGFKMKDWPKAESSIDVVVLAHTRFNAYYANAYTPDSNAPPDCWAVLDPTDPEATENEMAPTIDNPESPSCRKCPQNAFGSAAQGQGKACRNYQMLAVLPAQGEDDLTVASIAKAEGARIRIAPTSTGKWGNVVKMLGAKGLPLPLVQMRLHIEPDDKYQFVIEPEPLAVVNDARVRKALLSRRQDAIDQLLLPPPESDGDSKKTARTPTGRKTQKVQTRKKGTRKKITRSRA